MPIYLEKNIAEKEITYPFGKIDQFDQVEDAYTTYNTYNKQQTTTDRRSNCTT